MIESGQIRSRRVKFQLCHAVHSSLIFCLAIVCATSSLPSLSLAQQQESHLPLAAPQQSSSRSGDEQVMVNTDLISFNVTVTDRYGRMISGLDKTAFTVYDEKQPQELTYFSAEDTALSVGILFDVSGSMSGEKIERARDALMRFMETSHPEDEYSLIGFNSRADVLLERTHDADAVLRKFTYVEPHGNTALYDAVYLGIEQLQRGTYLKRVLLLITDGEENDSRYSFREVRDTLAESGTMLYSICLLDPINLTGKAGMRVQDTLNGLAEITGGRAFYPRSKAEMDEAFERIALELRHQYSIGYKPKNFISDGRWHRVKVRVAPPAGYVRLSVRSRQGYRALPALR